MNAYKQIASHFQDDEHKYVCGYVCVCLWECGNVCVLACISVLYACMYVPCTYICMHNRDTNRIPLLYRQQISPVLCGNIE